MATKKKLLQAAAGSAGGEALNVEDVFSTYLYEGTGSTLEINNGIDLDGEGGLVWAKRRNGIGDHWLVDTERGLDKSLKTNTTDANETGTNQIVSFDSDGFTLGNNNQGQNYNGLPYTSWTFRKAPKFFDVVTYTGDGNASQTISHSLGTTVGMLIIKKTSGTGNWGVYHRSLGNNKSLELETNGAAYNNVPWGSVTSTTFEARSDIAGNENGATYVAYLFAHNDGDGEFGGEADADIIKCGSYTGAGSTDVDVNLGFEPQWLMIKKSSSSGDNWIMFDNMRGVVTGAEDNRLFANLNNTDYGGSDYLEFTSTGFRITGTIGDVATSGATYIYIAIRRGPMAVPEDATEVFAVDTGSSSDPAFDSGFPVDFAIMTEKNTNTDNDVATRLLQGTGLRTNSTAAEVTGFSNFVFDFMDGWDTASYNTQDISWMWRRAPNFFDVVAYTGTGSNQTINHNLGVAPKFMIVKERTTANNWVCYLEALGNNKRMALNAASSVATDTTAWQSTTPTDNAFYVGANTQTNVSGEDFIAYLFGEVSGISKFGTYTGTGSAQNIDCGFSSGARFVLVKTYAGTNPNANWNIWDSERGIVAGNDPYLALNSASAEVTSADVIDPYSSGFSLTSSGVANNSGTSYWFYAIA